MIGGGVILPLYWLAFVLSGAPQNGSGISQVQAESALFGFLAGQLPHKHLIITLLLTNILFHSLGFAIPSASILLNHSNTYVVAIWQIFPILAGVSQQAYILLRPAPKGGNGSGYNVVQLTHFLTFIAAVVFHLGLNGPDFMAHPFQTLASVTSFFPSTQDPNPATSTSLEAVLDFLYWDKLLIVASALITPLFSMEDFGDAVKLGFGAVITAVLLGPGAAISALWMYRERLFESKSRLLPAKTALKGLQAKRQ